MTKHDKLLANIQKASNNYINQNDSMHIPPEDYDVDVVLSDCFDYIQEGQKRIDQVQAVIDGYKQELKNVKCADLYDKGWVRGIDAFVRELEEVLQSKGNKSKKPVPPVVDRPPIKYGYGT